MNGLEMHPSGAEAQLILLALSARLNSLEKKSQGSHFFSTGMLG
jgi:hypothetical protein